MRAVQCDAAADAELRDYQLHALEARVQNMPEGTERDYFSGMLASRSGQFDDAIARLNRALPGLRQSEPKRAAKHTGRAPVSAARSGTTSTYSRTSS